MQHPPLNGHDDPGNWASKTATNNIEYPAIEAANGQLPALFNGMTIEATGCYSYTQTETEDLQHVTIAVETALDKLDSNAAPMAFVGRFTGGGFVQPDYLIGPAYRALLAALASGDITELQKWYNTLFQGSMSNWSNFQNGLGIDQAVQKVTATILEDAGKRLPQV